MNGEFCDALTAALWLGGDLDAPGHSELVADIVLAMPEMQEVREFISRMANGPSPKMDGGRRQMEIWNLSETVIDWVLGGPS